MIIRQVTHTLVYCVGIHSPDSLLCLKSVKKLESIRLKDNTYNYSNPGKRHAHHPCAFNLKQVMHVPNISHMNHVMTCVLFHPVCKNPSYRNILLEMFPNIKVLDGESTNMTLLSILHFKNNLLGLNVMDLL